MYIPEEKVSEILNTSDIVDVISESVILKKSGRNFFGLCPFHAEKTPSFSVNASKQIFHCFGCSAGGNVLSYIMKYHGITFPEAAKMIARKYNITIETKEIDPAKRRQLNLTENLFRLNKTIMEVYFDGLKNLKTGEISRQYLKDRGINDNTIEKFKLGFSPDKWDTIVTVLKKRKISKNTAVQSGLILERKQNNGYYDRFRNRIMFPIFDVNMQVAGFGGRVMDDAMPKYMNSPETPIYNKSRILYGLHAAKQFCRQEGCVYIVEGYFDFLSLYQHGIKNTVASLGTALTPDHVRILKGYASRMILVFDSDAAGINAAKRSINIFMNEGVDTRILVLPTGNDPDSYVVKHGQKAFNELALSAKTMMQFLLQVSIDTHGLSVEGRIRILDDMKKQLILIHDSALRSLYVKELAETLNIDEKAVLEKVREQYLNHSGKKSFLSDGKKEDAKLESDRREEQIISLMLNYPEITDEIKDKKVLDYFYSEKLKSLAKKILSIDPAREAFITNVMASMENIEDQELIASYAINDFFSKQDIHQTVLSIINRIIRVRKKQENNLTTKIISAEKGCDSDLMDLLKEKQAEIKQLHDQL
ncbi:MAG: DNA primase [Desulfobacula sp.]|jgi:DNA primase|uniref:DNA primase n=1 Tax=Desulfobacula sp. TaxID=2593537 RepID=UPI001DCB23E1|nr:DNA primase [Desulfobacula sp.]MBT3485427.1 DNA primase [Desulfobacula sp.]MBT3805570.1 DNA primase [Desulfobacula sp.]MBT4026066.1 DNA primase [Desulfobacula sp.]MBT4199986.1 DNA primase [Desulfobacula sp.]